MAKIKLRAVKSIKDNLVIELPEGEYLHCQAMVDSGDWTFVEKADETAAAKAVKAKEAEEAEKAKAEA